jgi:PTH1 family peptidyl-tRNA hydrolase
MIELVAFLGNPGMEHAGNRHNAPWLLARKLPFYDALSWRDKYKGRYAEIDGSRIVPYAGPDFSGIPPERLRFIMPLTFMNLSGESVAAAASFFKIPPEGILVVHDELELPLGTVSLKAGGGLGGHNGLRSVKASLGTADFRRLRIGIGRPDDRLPGQGGPPGSGKGVYEWVLSDFTPDEAPTLQTALEAASTLHISTICHGGEVGGARGEKADGPLVGGEKPPAG